MGLNYKVYLDGNFLKEVENLNTVIDDLTKDKEYSLQVSETDGEVESPLSEAVKIITTIIQVEKILLDSTDKTMLISDSFQLSAKIQPENATFKEITWSSNNPSVAKVSETGLVEAVGVGSAEITAESINGIKGVSKFTVSPAVIIPTTNPIVSVFANLDSIGIEKNGFDTGESFGGTKPTEISLLNTKVFENNTLIGISSDWIADKLVAEPVEYNKYLAINDNKSIEITIE